MTIAKLREICDEISVLGPKKARLFLKKRDFKLKAEGCFKDVYVKKGCGFVVKHCSDRSGFMKRPRANSKLSMYFLDYDYLTKNGIAAIQRKVRTFDSPKLPEHEDFKLLSKKYDIHGFNIGKLKGKYVIIDF